MQENGAGAGSHQGARKLRKARKVAAVGAAGDRSRRLQELGDALDDAVRAARSGDALLEGMCRRVNELWSSERRLALAFTPTEIRSEGKLVLAASAEGGRFILPAHSAGLRVLTLERASTYADIARLCMHLAALETGALDPRGFAAFLLRGDALGFEALQAPSVYELGEALLPAFDAAALWSERSSCAVSLWNDLAWRAGQLPDAAGAAARSRAAIEQLHVGLRCGELELHDDELRALAELAADPVALCKAEIALLVQQPELRRCLPRDHLNLRLALVVEHAPAIERELPGWLTALGAEPRALDPRILGGALARRLEGRGLDDSVLGQLVSALGPELIAGMLAQLNEHGQGSEAAERLLVGLLHRAGLAGVLARLELGRMRPAFAAALARAAARLALPAGELLALLDRLPAASGLALLSALPALLPQAERTLVGLLRTRADELEANLPEFIRSSAAGRALCALHGRGLSRAGLQSITAALVAAGQGLACVLPLWESRQAESSVRLVALVALAAESALLREAMRRRGVEASDPPEIRIALEELRWRQP